MAARHGDSRPPTVVSRLARNRPRASRMTTFCMCADGFRGLNGPQHGYDFLMGLPAATNKVVLDFTSPDGKIVTHVRSTLLSSSVQTLKDNGFFERYERVLSP